MKILFLGDGSAYHANLAVALRRQGHDVTVASDGTRWMQTDRDIDLQRAFGKTGGAMLWMKMSSMMESQFTGFDIVHLSSPSFTSLKPVRLAVLLKKIKAGNGRLFYSALGTDSDYVRNCLYGTPPVLRYSEWHDATGHTPWSHTAQAEAEAWLSAGLTDYTDEFFCTVEGAVSALYEYHKVIEAMHPGLPLAYGGIPVDLSDMPRHKLSDGPVRILYAAHKGREGEKGADILLGMLRRVESELKGTVVVDTPENVPYHQFRQRLAGYDVVSDQLYSFTPATTALMAMAMGVVPIIGGTQEFYDFIGERELRPIFNPDPLDLEGTYQSLKTLLSDRDALRSMSEQGPEFIRRHNDAGLVARRFVDFWNN